MSWRYIDVSFHVTKYGRGERIEVLDSSEDATRDDRRNLLRLIASTSFRPSVVDGEIADAAAIVERHCLP